MKLCVIGTGYVGLVTGTCFAEMGNDVICVDNDDRKIGMLQNNQIPIYEPGLDRLVERNVREGRLSFTKDTKTAVEKSLTCFIAVGTPPDEDGSADLQYVLAVAREIGTYMNEYKIIVDKSTVPVGTADLVSKEIRKALDARGAKFDFDVVSNPEFLKEGAAIDDFMKPDRVVVGVDNPQVGETMKTLYAPFSRAHDKTILMSVRSAEMTKYAANAMLATKISFMNEIARLCEATNADVDEVRRGIGSDTRIGYKFIYAGVGYGGSRFPKDVKALLKMSKDIKLPSKLLDAVETVNEEQKHVLPRKVLKHFDNNIAGKTFAVWGLSFKPETDDMREAPSIVIINDLIAAGAKIRATDPVAIEEAKHKFTENAPIEYVADHYEACKGCDGLLLITEWHAYRDPDFGRIMQNLNQPVIFDGRNQYEPTRVRKLGFDYYGIGKP